MNVYHQRPMQENNESLFFERLQKGQKKYISLTQRKDVPSRTSGEHPLDNLKTWTLPKKDLAANFMQFSNGYDTMQWF